MTRTQWLLSAFFLAFIGIKTCEGLFQLEAFPLTHTPMFARRFGAEKLPRRVTLHGRRGEGWVDVTAADLALGEAELVRQIVRHLRIDRSFTRVCLTMGRQYNARHRDAPLSVFLLRLKPVPRPGIAAAGDVIEVPCSP